MNVTLIAHTALSDAFQTGLQRDHGVIVSDVDGYNERAAAALTAIRTCYSPLAPTAILPAEGAKYFGTDASDGEGGTDADRLFRHIVRSGHKSTLEHVSYSFAIEGVSRSLLAQITRHRQLSFSVQSQRYVKFGSGDRSGGFDYVTPPSVKNAVGIGYAAEDKYRDVMRTLQSAYDSLRLMGVPAEDARFVLPNAAECNLVMTGNLRALLEFYGKRRKGNGAQWEVAELAERIREEITKVDGWVARFFDVGEAHE